MAEKVRVYELAKENNMAAKEMVKLLNEEFGLNIKSHMSMVGGSDLELIQGYFDEIEEEKNKAKNKKHQKVIYINSKINKNHYNIKLSK
ncbi:translation initiation factor IF-2 N-terminal domain-containing protein, partial [Anaerococcus sp.]|uniref:translation initiation factor IF-2 N-terminal domain-containing protein n=1 Tax=Anaerococcus sp. TaxID=1872515 RepID=UPI0027BA9643